MGHFFCGGGPPLWNSWGAPSGCALDLFDIFVAGLFTVTFLYTLCALFIRRGRRKDRGGHRAVRSRSGKGAQHPLGDLSSPLLNDTESGAEDDEEAEPFNPQLWSSQRTPAALLKLTAAADADRVALESPKAALLVAACALVACVALVEIGWTTAVFVGNETALLEGKDGALPDADGSEWSAMYGRAG
jgi:hypothetical protein